LDHAPYCTPAAAGWLNKSIFGSNVIKIRPLGYIAECNDPPPYRLDFAGDFDSALTVKQPMMALIMAVLVIRGI
jgi:hypothetical protein